VARHLRDRKLQRALMQFFKPENYFAVREALRQTGRQDLIGNGCDCLIPAAPPREAREARRREANAHMRGDDARAASGSKKKKGKRKESRHKPGQGYRPDRESAADSTTPRKKKTRGRQSPNA